jgi:hypothetical protein
MANINIDQLAAEIAKGLKHRIDYPIRSQWGQKHILM